MGCKRLTLFTSSCMGESGHNGSGRSANTLHGFTSLGKQQGGKYSTKMDKMGKKPPKKIFLRATKDIRCGRGISSLLPKCTQSWICARQLGRQDIANSSLNPREVRPCSWQTDAVFAAGRQQLHPLPSCRSSFLLFFKAASG